VFYALLLGNGTREVRFERVVAGKSTRRLEGMRSGLRLSSTESVARATPHEQLTRGPSYYL
jgi:hypothetical protein